MVPREPARWAATINFDSSLWVPIQTLGTSFKKPPSPTATSGLSTGGTTPYQPHLPVLDPLPEPRTDLLEPQGIEPPKYFMLLSPTPDVWEPAPP